MGVKRLSKFVEERPGLLQDYKLSNTKLIVDGNSVKHELMHFDDVINGGDYDTYSKRLRHFFRNLKSCGVIAYVLFDGADNPNDEKLQTILSRARSNITSVDNLIRGSTECSIFPMLGHETLRNVLVELDIQHCTCDFEADEQMVVLANEWRCPILSNDSDFYIYHVVSGYIPFHKLSFNDFHNTSSEMVDKSKPSFVDAKIYFLEEFAGLYFSGNLTLPLLLPCLLGNDFVNEDIFLHFTRKLQQPDKKVQCQAKKDKVWNIQNVIYWLSGFQSKEEAMSVVVESFPQHKQTNVRNVMQNSVLKYQATKDKLSSCVLDYFTTDGNLRKDIAEEPLTGYGNAELPKWFTNAVRRSEVPVFALNVAIHRRVMLRCQVEDIDKGSCYNPAFAIRKVIYDLITNVDGEHVSTIPNDSLDKNRNTSVEEYDREANVLRSTVIGLMDSMTSGDRNRILPKLRAIPTLSLEEKTSLLQQSLMFSSEEVHRVPKDSKLFTLVIQFWAANSRYVEPCHVKALITCHVIMKTLSYADPARISEGYGDIQHRYQKILLKFSEDDFQVLMSNYEYFKDKSRRVPNFQLLHPFAEFQACLMATIHLNQLLMCPFYSPDPALIYNGSFVVNLSSILSGKREERQNRIISEIFSQNSSLMSLYGNILHVALSTAKTLIDNGTSRKFSELKRSEDTNSDVSHTSSARKNKMQYESCVSTASSSLNRFSVLSLDEECP